MNKLFLAAFFFTMVACARGAEPSVAGTWTITDDVQGRVTEGALQLEQKGEKLSGQIKQGDGQSIAVVGECTGNQVTFTYPRDLGGKKITVKHAGALGNEGIMTGSVEIAPLGLMGTFRAKRQADAPAGSAVEIPSSKGTLARVTVDCSVSLGELRHTERYNNFPNPTIFPEQRRSDAQYLNAHGLRGRLYRGWIYAETIYNKDTNTFDFTPLQSYLADINSCADEVMFNLKATTLIEKWKFTPAQLRPIFTQIIIGLKKACPNLTYIESINEPDSPLNTYGEMVTQANLYQYYQAVYQAVNEANRQLQLKSPLKVGGPALFYLNIPWLSTFLDAYKADTAADKRLDFISYHAYVVPSADGGYFFFKQDPSVVTSERLEVERLLAIRGLNTATPSFIDETGMYPGPMADQTVGADQLRQAAGTLALHYWYLMSPSNYPLHWVTRHSQNGRKDQFVTRDTDNKPSPLTNIPTPYGNVLQMQSMLKTQRVFAEVPPAAGGKGVYVLASRDASGFSAMIWNYQGTEAANYEAKITVKSLQSVFASRSVRIRVYRVDSSTSNWYHDPAHADLQMVSEEAKELNGSYDTSLHLEANSVHLIQLEPATSP